MQSALTNNAEVDFLTEGASKVNVYCSKTYPYADVTKDTEIESIMQNECLQKFFLKAVIIAFPKFLEHRMNGIYIYGKAKAELLIVKDNQRLKIEADSLDSLPDMAELQKKIWAGTIAPSISYEGKQVKRHPLDILAQILDSKSLNKVQRFCLALRLTRQKR